jgi:hypothetical protein
MFISLSDPAAQWTGAMRGPTFFAYADNYLIDVKFGAIMDVEASRAIRHASARRADGRTLLGQFYQHRMARRGADVDQPGFFQMM